MAKSSSTLLVIALLAIGLNFSFDWFRRYEFEDQKLLISKKLDDEIKQIKQQSDIGQMLIQEAIEKTGQLEEVFRVLQSSSNELLKLFLRVPEEAARADTPANVPNEPTEISRTRLDKRILDTPAEEMEEKIKSCRKKDRMLFQQLSELESYDPGNWPINKLIDDLQKEFGVTLTAEETATLETKSETYQLLRKAADTNYDASLALSVGARTEAGEFEPPDNTGGYLPDPSISSEEVFATRLGGQGRYRWTKSGYKEEYKAKLCREYIPYVMLEDLRSFFAQRRAR